MVVKRAGGDNVRAPPASYVPELRGYFSTKLLLFFECVRPDYLVDRGTIGNKIYDSAPGSWKIV